MHIDINVRWASLTYQASCPGQKLRATNVISQDAAAKSLVVKLYPTAKVDQVVCIKAAAQGQTEVWRCHLSFEEK